VQVQPLVFGLEFLVLGAERSVFEIQLLVGHLAAYQYSASPL
jgi:hypothetical protein